MLSEFSECALIAVPRVEMPMTSDYSPVTTQNLKKLSVGDMETLPLSVFNRLCSVLLQKGVWFCSLLKSNYAWVGMWFSKVLRGRHKSHFPPKMKPQWQQQSKAPKGTWWFNVCIKVCVCEAAQHSTIIQNPNPLVPFFWQLARYYRVSQVF